jgi:tetratricopeptide (TPR) repeat protein
MALKPPRNPSADRRGPGASDLALQNAAAAIQAGRAAEAEKLAADVLKANAGSLPALQMLGTALLMQGRGEEAIAPLERATRQARDAPTEMHLAMALRQAGREQEACERFERAIKRKPPFPPAFLEFASLLSALNRYDDAIGILQHGLAIAPNFAEMSVRLGRIYAAQGRNAEARDVLARAVVLAPADPDALYALARTRQALHEFAQAAETYRRILAATPKHGPALIGLGICLIELGRTEEALGHLRVASRASARMYGEVVTALVDAGRGRFWLRPSDAARALRGDST